MDSKEFSVDNIKIFNEEITLLDGFIKTFSGYVKIFSEARWTY